MILEEVEGDLMSEGNEDRRDFEREYHTSVARPYSYLPPVLPLVPAVRSQLETLLILGLSPSHLSRPQPELVAVLDLNTGC